MQTIKALREAEKYKGPSIVIAYASCINHGLNMTKGLEHGKNAVDSGYWPLYRFNPELQEKGKNPFIKDSKEPKINFRDYILSETRYKALKVDFPDIAEELYNLAEDDSKNRQKIFNNLANRDN
ncbi:MAG: pyruvate:ferredoxin (flavodoxin) oxidoreductase, partial [Nanobdellota archaeon]